MTSKKQSEKQQPDGAVPPSEIVDAKRIIDQHPEIKSIITASYSGPLPPPVVLQQYEEVLPGMADRILAMAEKEQDARHKLEAVVIPEAAKAFKRSQYISCIIVVVAILSTIPLSIWANPVFAGLVCAGGFLPLVITSYFGNKESDSTEEE